VKTFIALAIVAVLATVGAMGGIRIRNELVALDTEVDTQWQQVENQLQRRHELLPKLAAVAQRYAAHEKDTFTQLADSRAAYAKAAVDAKPGLAHQIDGALVHVLALAESYPELKADRQFTDLAYEIAGTQNRIALERARYNEVVGLRNARIRQLPWSLLASGMQPRPLYDPPAETLADPELGL
jgi:LemA protein